MSKSNVTFCACLIAVAMNVGCANTVRGVQQDAERATEKTVAATETVDVKSALIADSRVDASNINVDTIASSKTVVLKGSVPSEQQRRTAEEIARGQAKGYTITNQLTIAQK
jgi:hyperosmotically inducible protein